MFSSSSNFEQYSDTKPSVNKCKYVVLKSDYVFKMESVPRGRCLILNNINYEYLKYRHGSEENGKKLQHVFQELGFSVIEKKDLKGEAMKDLLKKVSKDDCKEVFDDNGHGDALVIVILAHGCRDGVLGIDKEEVSYRFMVDCMNNVNAPSLQNKPKIFFIQADYGDNRDFGIFNADSPNKERIGLPIKEQAKGTLIPTACEVFFSFAAQESYKPIENYVSGGLYSQILASTLAEFACEFDLEDLLKLVEDRMQRALTDTKKGVCVSSTRYKAIGWSKKLYFNPGYSGNENVSDIPDIRNIYSAPLEILNYVQDSATDILTNQDYDFEKFYVAPKNIVEAEKALETAVQLRKISFAAKCSKVLENNLEKSSKNCIKYFILSKRLSTNLQLELHEKAKDFILCNLELAVTTPEFISLTLEDLQEFISSDKLFVDNEDVVVRAIHNWILSNPNQSEHKSSLMNNVQINLCSKQCLEDAEMGNMILSPNDSNLIQSAIRLCYQVPLLFVIGGKEKDQNKRCSVELYNPATGIWNKKVPFDKMGKSNSVAAVFLNRKLVVVSSGGTWIWDLENLTWVSRSTMKNPRDHFCSTEFNGMLFIMGGRISNLNKKAEAKCEIYDVYNDRWIEIKDMKMARYDASATTLKGKIYCAGGQSGKKLLDSVEEYDPDQADWSYVTKLSSPRSEFSLVACDNYLWSFGGRGKDLKLVDVDRLDLDQPKLPWVKMPPLPEARSGVAAVCIGKNIFVMGGLNQKKKAVNTVNVWDIADRRWLESGCPSGQLLSPRHGHIAVVLPELIISTDTNGFNGPSQNEELYRNGQCM